MNIRRLALAGCCGALLAAPPAAGQEDGVFIDPDSPAGREYAIPGEEAREQADPRGDDRRGGGRSDAPAFGAGVGDGGGDATGGAGDGGSGSGGGSGDDGESGSAGSASANAPPATDEARRALQAAGAKPTPDSSGTVLAIAGSAALVLLLGLGGGMLARRRGQRP